MSETLYRKYRPQSFKDIIGQEHIKITLENEIKNGKIAHAYLFSGPRGIGKTTMARILAKSINCQEKNNGDFEPCNKCQSCLSMIKGNNLDLIEIDAASNRRIDEIRELRERIKYAPTNSKYKVFIIDEVHMLTIESFNALLKTLEEPPQHAIFILATTELHKLPITIVSRCERFDFKVVDIEQLKTHLKNIALKEKVKVSDLILEKVARHSQGYVRDALSMLGQVLALAENNEVKDDSANLVIPKSDYQLVTSLIEDIISEKFVSAMETLNTLVVEGIDLKYFTEELINYLRKIILIKLSDSSTQEYFFDLEKEIEEKIISQSTKLDLKIWFGILKEFYNTFKYLNNNSFKQLPLEMAVVSIKNKYFIKNSIEMNDEYSGVSQKDENLLASDISKKDKNLVKDKQVKFKDKFSKSSGNLTSIPKIKIEQSSKANLVKNKTLNPTKSSSNIKVSVQKVIKVWPQLIINLKDYNHSLSAFVKVGHPLDVKENKLNLGFKFQFHLDRVLQNDAKRKVEDILESLLNAKLIIDGQIDSNYEENHEKMVSAFHKGKEKDAVLIDNLIQNFGGELVN